MIKFRCLYIVFFLICFAFSSQALEVNINYPKGKGRAKSDEGIINVEIAKGKGSKIIEIVKSYNDKDWAKTIKLSKSALEDDPKNDALYYYLGLGYLFSNENELAEMNLLKAVELDSTNFWYIERLARIYTITKQPDKAIGVYEQIMKSYPKNHTIYYNLIELYLSSNLNDKALETLDQIDLVFGETEETVMVRFDILRSQSKQEEAVAALKRFNDNHSSIRVLVALGDYELSSYNDSLALGYYNEALDLDPTMPTALLGKAEVYRMKMNYDEYFEVLKKFIIIPELSPQWKSEYIKAVIQRGDGRFVYNNKEDIDDVIDKLVSTHPADSSALKCAGTYYLSVSENEKAKEVFNMYKDSYKEDIGVRGFYLSVLAYLEDWKEVTVQADSASRVFPDDLFILEYKTFADFNLKDYDSVLETIDVLLKKGKKNKSILANAYSMRGNVYYEKGLKAKAFREYEKSLSYNPANIPLLNNYAYYLSVDKKKLGKAEVMSRTTIEAEPDNPTYLDTYGWILHLLGRSAEAKTHFKRSMLYGGKENVVVVDHYAEVLFSLGEYDLAMFYWQKAISINKGEIKDLEAKIKARKSERNQKDKK